jgi:hypothetical protein
LRDTTYRIVKHFEETGNTHYKRETERERSASLRTEEIVGVAREAIIKKIKKVWYVEHNR